MRGKKNFKAKVGLILGCGLLFAQTLLAQTYGERYNLTFATEGPDIYRGDFPGWTLNAKNSEFVPYTIKGRKYTGINSSKHYLSNDPFDVDLFSREPLTLPGDLSDRMVAEVTCSGSRMNRATMFIYRTDPASDTVVVDTVRMSASSGANTSLRQLKRVALPLCYVRFRAESAPRDSYIPNYYRSFKLAELRLRSRGRVINDSIVRPLPTVKWDPAQALSRATDELPQTLAAPRILALGTTMKHSLRSVKAAYDLTRRRIEAGGCRTVVMDRDMSRTLYLNRYVAGDSRFPRSLVVRLLDADYSHIAAEKEQLLAFLDWVRTYNEGRSDKVRLIGGDLLSEHNALNGFDFGNWGTYFERFRDTKSAAIDSLVKMATGESYPSQLAPEPQIAATDFRDFILRHDGELAEVLGGDEVRLIRYFFEHTGVYMLTYVDLKDVERRYNGGLTFIVNELCAPDERVTLLAPLEHLHFSRTVRPWLTSAGRLLRARHGADYACWALLTGQESRTIPVYPAPREDVEALGPAREGSLELLLGKALTAPAFIPATAFDGIGWVRCFDSYQGDRNHYDPVCPPRAFDGVVWCR